MTSADAARVWRVVVVDDEAPARLVLTEMLAARPDVLVVGEADDGVAAVQLIDARKPDIAFLDIEMPRLGGFEALELIDPRVAVIFATAYDSYAVRAFEVHAVDYLLKPFTEARLAAAMARVHDRASTPRTVAAVTLTAQSRPVGVYSARLAVRDRDQVHVFAVDELDSAVAQGDYVELQVGKKAWLKQQTLQSLEACLDPQRFVRIHRSALINLARLVRIDSSGKDARIAVLAGGRTLPISRSGHARLLALLDR